MAASVPEPDYRELVERVGDMIYTLDLAGEFTLDNSAGLAVLGYDADGIIGRHFRTMLTPRSGRVTADHFAQGIAGTESTPFSEVQAVRKDGAVIDLEIRAGNLFRDLSARSRTEVVAVATSKGLSHVEAR